MIGPKNLFQWNVPGLLCIFRSIQLHSQSPKLFIAMLWWLSFKVFTHQRLFFDEKVRFMFPIAWYFLLNLWFGICRNIFINPSQIFHIEKINRISQTSYDFFLSFFYWPIMLWYISSWSLKNACMYVFITDFEKAFKNLLWQSQTTKSDMKAAPFLGFNPMSLSWIPSSFIQEKLKFFTKELNEILSWFLKSFSERIQ